MNLYWFRNNLRLRDNPSLAKAVYESEKIAFIYILEDRLLQEHALGFPCMSSYRKNFLYEALKNLSENIENLGGKLHLFQGESIQILKQLVKINQVKKIYASHEVGYYEQQEEKKVLHFTEFISIDDNSLFSSENIPFDIEKLPFVFTSYRKKVEKHGTIRIEESPILNIESSPIKSEGIHTFCLLDQTQKTHPFSAFGYRGGEGSAWQRIKDYFWDSKNLAVYKNTRNAMIGEAYSSKLSPFLSIGNISPIAIYYEVKRFEKEICSNQSTYWLIFELLWRDFFRMTSLKYGKSIFHESGINQSTPPASYKNQKAFRQWIEGETTDGFVNANMIELKKTGFMSNRGRQNVASYLVHNLQLPWQWGAAYFESLLIDYDCASNWCNWMYIAGVGNDPRHRKFNTQLQAERYDSKKEYQSLWLDEDQH